MDQCLPIVSVLSCIFIWPIVFAHIGVIVAEIDSGHAVRVAGIGLAMRPAINDQLVVGMRDGDHRFSNLRAGRVEHDQIGRAEALPVMTMS